MKQVILLVGAPGSGKSTFCKESLSDYYRVSQDDMGKLEHFTAYLDALRNGTEKIVVDRMNFSMAQRHDYLDLAKEHGYATKIITLHQPFKVCYERICKRENHPTLQKDKALQVLSFFHDKYEYPQDWEADKIERSVYDPFMLDLSNTSNRKILVGDVHGCMDEFLSLLAKCKFTPLQDMVLLGGDYIDRGPKVKEIISFLRNGYNVFTTMSNHENKFLRYLRGNNVSIAHGMEKTLEQLDDVLRDETQKLELRMWLESLPYVIKFDKDKYLCHAGINPEQPMTLQTKANLIYARTFDPVDKSFTKASAPQWWSFPGPKDTKVYFGHQVHPNANVSNWAVALDGGCVSGQKLRANVLNTDGTEEIIEVDGKPYMVDEVKDYNEALEPYFNAYKDKLLSKSGEG